jgi:hypothetical protein
MPSGSVRPSTCLSSDPSGRRRCGHDPEAESRPRTRPTARAQAEDSVKRLERVTKALESAQKDVASIRGSLGTGVRDLRRDVTKMLKDARRDLAKMRRAIQRDLEKLQRDLDEATSPRPVPARKKVGTGRTPRRREAH